MGEIENDHTGLYMNCDFLKKGSGSGGLVRIYMKSFILQQMFCFVIRKLSPHKKLVNNALQT
jgi:hypothetical protein